MALPIEDYAMIGDRNTAALVGHRRLDRLAVPAAVRLPRLLRGAARRQDNGQWQLGPVGELRGHPAYVGDTAALQTTFTTRPGR